MFKWLGMFLLLSSLTWAQNSYRFEIYGSSTYNDVNDRSEFNPDNAVLEQPEWAHVLELRPDLSFQLHENHSLVVRSRHFLSAYEREYQNPTRQRTSILSESDLSDFFFSSQWKNNFSTDIGLQNYQWGPAEIFSPSNPFFHFNNAQRSFFYKEKGRVLVRANWNPDPETSKWSVVGLYEPTDNRDPFWTADRDFKPKSALKIERQFENPVNSLAFVVGQGEESKNFFGEYFTWSPKEGISLYADVKHQQGRTNWVPTQDNFGFYNMTESDSERLYTLGIFGFRWEGRVDFRQEFIWNEAGYSRSEWKNAKSAGLTLSPNILQNLRRFSAPGLEFYTKAYSYTSLRIPDLGKRQATSAAARWLSSMSENSSVLQLNLEHNWSDSTVLQAEVLEFMGEQGSEFRLINDRQVALGFRWSY